MKYSQSLTKNRDFHRLYSRGKSAVTPYMVVYCRKNGRDVNRIGFTVSRKLGKAVRRNRIRRRLRELYRLHEQEFQRGYDIVIVARGRGMEAEFSSLKRYFLSACDKLSLRERVTEGDEH